MRSKTKYEVDETTLIKLFEKAGIAGAENIAPLGAGEYNSVYAADAGGKAYAIKIAPLASAKILTYEQQMMAQEVFYYAIMAEQAGVRVPKIYYSDFSKSEIPAEYFIMERLPGKQIDQTELSALQKEAAEKKLIAMVAQIHTVKGDKFGYRQNGLHDNWYLALQAMVSNLIDDGKAMGKRTKRGEKLLAYIQRNQQVLERVECSLINFDIWPPNIFVDWENGDLNLSWIDPERCLWGDHIADFVCLDFMNMTLDKKSKTIEQYNQVAEKPVVIDQEEKIRLAIMLGYLGLIMEVEKYSRYSYFHFGYWRNVTVARMLFSSSGAFKKISVETLEQSLPDIVSGSAEDSEAAKTGTLPETGGEAKPAGTKALDQYTINLTERALKGEIDPVLGRDFEIRQMVDILIRRRQNNPILTGEAGVGKTAVVEGFALRIAEGDVPPVLRGVALHTLDLGLLQAGAGIKGEFENRLKSVMNEVKASPVPIILFIDEAHTLIGAGAQGAGDAANLLKPALARGELRTIAATTWAEYKKYFEKDAALARRFQVVKVEEPDEEKALVMMRAIGPFLEKHHNVMITDDALADTVSLSHRYISGRQLPDKAVSVLDTACARVAIGLTTSPAPIEESTRQIAHIEREVKTLERETLMGREHGERLEVLEKEKGEVRSRLDDLNKRWEDEMEVAGKIMDIRQEIRDIYEKEPQSEELPEKQKTLTGLEKDLAERQGDSPLVQVAVDSQTVSEVISGWTGIPTGRMQADEIETVLNMENLLGERIIGQEHALAAIAQMIQTSQAGIEDPSKPTAVFLFVGPSGVGKTETALVLSDLLYGGEQNVITINMSEYQEAHTVSSLKGSPPGYVGYGEGGVLTEAVRRRPYSVVLLDEVEKAHTDVTELFYQVFDKGMMEDGEGRLIDFKNTLIILTSNLGTDMIMNVCADEETMPIRERWKYKLQSEVMLSEGDKSFLTAIPCCMSASYGHQPLCRDNL